MVLNPKETELIWNAFEEIQSEYAGAKAQAIVDGEVLLDKIKPLLKRGAKIKIEIK